MCSEVTSLDAFAFNNRLLFLMNKRDGPYAQDSTTKECDKERSKTPFP